MTDQERLMLREIYQWMQEKKRQQISYPLDDASKKTIGVLIPTGVGSFGTQNINLSGDPETITPPAQPSGTLKVIFGSTEYELLHK